MQYNFVICDFDSLLIAQVCKPGVSITSGTPRLDGDRGLTPTALLDALPAGVAGQFIEFRDNTSEMLDWTAEEVIRAAREQSLPERISPVWRPEGVTVRDPELTHSIALDLTIPYYGPCDGAYNLAERCRGVWVERRSVEEEKGLAKLSLNEDGTTQIEGYYHELFNIIEGKGEPAYA